MANLKYQDSWRYIKFTNFVRLRKFTERTPALKYQNGIDDFKIYFSMRDPLLRRTMTIKFRFFYVYSPILWPYCLCLNSSQDIIPSPSVSKSDHRLSTASLKCFSWIYSIQARNSALVILPLLSLSILSTISLQQKMSIVVIVLEKFLWAAQALFQKHPLYALAVDYGL